MALTTYLDLAMRWVYTNPLDLTTPTDNANVSLSDSLTNGTGAVDTADIVWSDTRTLAATTENLDLAGSLTNAFGATITFARIKGIIIHNKNSSVGAVLTVGGAASNAFPLFSDTSDKYPIGPDGVFLVWEPSAAAKAVTASTGDILKMDSGAATITYDIIIVGSSA